MSGIRYIGGDVRTARRIFIAIGTDFTIDIGTRRAHEER